MNVEEQVRAELGRLALQVRAAPDPLGRLAARRRRSRSRWAWGAGGAALVAALVAGVLPQLAQPATHRPAPLTRVQWLRQVVDAPARGNVGTRFAADLAVALYQQNQAGLSDPALNDGHDVPAARREVRALLVQDVGDERVAAVALLSPDYHDDGYADSSLLLLLAPGGADATTLARAALRDGKPAGTGLAIAQSLGPFSVGEVGVSGEHLPGPMTAFGMAPPGCQIDTARVTPGSTAGLTWQSEPTGSFIIRTGAQRRAELWRAQCDGVVRGEVAAPTILDPNNPDSVQPATGQKQSTLDHARGTPDPDAAATAVLYLAVRVGGWLSDRPGVVWGGPVPDLPGGPAEVVVAAAPIVGGGWAGQLVVPSASSVDSQGALFNAASDPFDPSTLLAIWLGQDAPTSLLVVAPTGAVTVRVSQGGRVVDESAVSGGAAIVSLPDGSSRDGVSVEALDPAGRPLASSTPVGPGLTLGAPVAGWDD